MQMCKTHAMAVGFLKAAREARAEDLLRKPARETFWQLPLGYIEEEQDRRMRASAEAAKVNVVL